MKSITIYSVAVLASLVLLLAKSIEGNDDNKRNLRALKHASQTKRNMNMMMNHDSSKLDSISSSTRVLDHEDDRTRPSIDLDDVFDGDQDESDEDGDEEDSEDGDEDEDSEDEDSEDGDSEDEDSEDEDSEDEDSEDEDSEDEDSEDEDSEDEDSEEGFEHEEHEDDHEHENEDSEDGDEDEEEGFELEEHEDDEDGRGEFDDDYYFFGFDDDFFHDDGEHDEDFESEDHNGPFPDGVWVESDGVFLSFQLFFDLIQNNMGAIMQMVRFLSQFVSVELPGSNTGGP